MLIKLILLLFVASITAVPINDSSSVNVQLQRPLVKRALSYIANDTVCIIDNSIYKNGDLIPTDDPCESCKCRPPGFACVLRECDVKPGCKEIHVQGECCPTYQCGCEHDGKFYKDGEIISSSNEFLKCYRCKCKGTTIICEPLECLFRSDCQSRYRPGECCPNYDHCDHRPPITSTEQSIFPTTLKTTNLTTVIISFSSDSILDDKIDSSTSKFRLISPELDSEPQTSNTISPSKNSESSINSKTINKESNNEELNNQSSSDHSSPDKMVMRNSSSEQEISTKSNPTLSVTDDSESSSSPSSTTTRIPFIEDSETTRVNFIQADQLDRRIDEIRKEDKNETTTIVTNLKESLRQQPSTTIGSIDFSVISSTTIPNITDTTILAPNNNLMATFITQSPIPKDEIIKKENDSEEMVTYELSTTKADKNLEIKESNAEKEEENFVKKLEAKLEEKVDEKPDEKYEILTPEKPSTDQVAHSVDEEIKMPIELLRKVLEKCKDNKCINMDKLIKVTEYVLQEYDTRIIEKVKLSEQFEQLKLSLFGNSTIPIPLIPSTDSPTILNSTESGVIELDDDQYPTTLKYMQTSDLVAEHKEVDGDDLELKNEDDLNKTLKIFY